MRGKKIPESKSAEGDAAGNAQSFDIIGDVHGKADELHALLKSLGYRSGVKSYRHPNGRKVIFLGDFIDRGQKIRAVLETVRGMVDAGEALAILGNHELNAMRFHTIGCTGEYLREHTAKNVHQHQATLAQFPDPEEWAGWLRWFAGLPLWLDLGHLRAVHACWDSNAIRKLEGIGLLEGPTLEKYSRKGTAEYDTISRILNGPEARLPEGMEYKIVDGHASSEIRVKWWIDLKGLSCREAIFPDDPGIPDLPPLNVPRTGYSKTAPPVFFGHYSQRFGPPVPIRENLACLDYGKGGFLTAYRWDGESTIDPDKFVIARQRNGGQL